jgi:CheY-like chemotaxis protein
MVNVLLVESGAKIQGQLQDALKKVAFTVKTTNWGSDILKLLEQKHADLVLVRNKLDDSTASECIAELRKIEKYATFPVCIIYGKMDSRERMDAWRSGADDVVAMPFVMPELLMQIHIRLQRTHLHKNLGIPLSLSLNSEKTPEKPEDDNDAVPQHGLINSTPLPKLFSLVWFKRATGVLRLIEGKHIRAFYVRDGYICGANSTVRDELFHRYMLKTCCFPGETKREFKLFSETITDRDFAFKAIELCGLRQETFDSLAVRYIQTIAAGALSNRKGEFDWVADDSSDEFYVVGFRGIHPAHMLLSVFRLNVSLPDYREMLSNKDLLLVPNSSAGILRSACSLTPSESCAIANTVSGVTLSNWLFQSRIVLPYADAFMYIMLLFKYFFTVDKHDLDPDEALAVALPGSSNEAKMTSYDPVSNVIDIEDCDISPEVVSGNQHSNRSPEQEASRNVEVPKLPVKKHGTGQFRKARIPENRPTETLLDKELNAINKQQTTSHRSVRTVIPSKQHSDELENTLPSSDILSVLKVDESRLKQGHIWDVHPGVIMVLAMKYKKTGVMTFSDAASESRMYWQDGKLLYAKSTKPEFRVDQVLYDTGIIDEKQRAFAADLWESSGGMRTGTELIRMQIVNPMDLTEGVKEQIRLIIRDVFTMPAGDYTFKTGNLPTSEFVAFDISTERIFTKSLKSIDSLGDLEKIVPSLNRRFRTTPAAISKAHDARLEGMDINILNRFRKETSLKTVFVEMDIGLQVFKNSITALYLLDYLEIVGPINE